MAAQELVKNLPESTRRWLYSGYAVLGLGIGATQVAYSAAEAGQPTWLTVALAVYAFVGTALGFTAAQNTGAEPVEIVDEVTSAALDREVPATPRAHPTGGHGDSTTAPRNTTP